MNVHLSDDERNLGRALHEKVDQLNDAPLRMSVVRSKAGSIRRNRRIAVGASLAAAAVIVVPTALAASGGLDRTDGPRPATASAAPTQATEPIPSETATDAPTEPRGSTPFDVSDLTTGTPPAIEWSDGGDVHRTDGSIATGVLPPGTAGFAPMGSGWVVATYDDEGGAAQWVGSVGEPGESYPLDGGLATSPQGEVVAWAEPNGDVRVIQRDGDETFTMPPVGAPGAYAAVAVSSEDCKEARTTAAGCTVFVNTVGEQAQAWATISHGFSDRMDEEVLSLTSWRDGLYAGITAFNDDLTTCSAVREPDTLSTVWETCAHRLLDFSPQGRHLLAVGSVGDGFGDGEVAVLDATDGRVLVDLRSDEQHQTTALQLAWEDDSHALLVTYADGQWAVVRLGLDGSMEYAVPPRRGSDLDRPFFLQS